MEKNDLKSVADFMDSKFNFFGIKVGWDAILGFIPGIGDVITNLFSFYILFQGALRGAPPVIIARMGLNILIDNVLDAIPVFGNFLDIFWRANSKNVALVDQYLMNPTRAAQTSKWVLASALAVAVGVVAVSVYLIVMVTIFIFHFFKSQLASNQVWL
jgi:hypothetical protein